MRSKYLLYIFLALYPFGVAWFFRSFQNPGRSVPAPAPVPVAQAAGAGAGAGTVDQVCDLPIDRLRCSMVYHPPKWAVVSGRTYAVGDAGPLGLLVKADFGLAMFWRQGRVLFVYDDMSHTVEQKKVVDDVAKPDSLASMFGGSGVSKND